MNISSALTKYYENISPITTMKKQTQTNPILSAIALAKADSKGAPVPPCGDYFTTTATAACGTGNGLLGQTRSQGQAGGYKMLAKLAKIGKDDACKGNF